MNPTREQFEMAAKAAELRLEWDKWLDIPTSPSASSRGGAWHPHIPGVDNAMLAAKLKLYAINWSTEMAWAENEEGDIGGYANYSDFIGTDIERRAKAMAFAMFLVAVEIGKGV